MRIKCVAMTKERLLHVPARKRRMAMVLRTFVLKRIVRKTEQKEDPDELDDQLLSVLQLANASGHYDNVKSQKSAF
jgi:hypothetical protein